MEGADHDDQHDQDGRDPELLLTDHTPHQVTRAGTARVRRRRTRRQFGLVHGGLTRRENAPGLGLAHSSPRFSLAARRYQLLY